MGWTQGTGLFPFFFFFFFSFTFTKTSPRTGEGMEAEPTGEASAGHQGIYPGRV